MVDEELNPPSGDADREPDRDGEFRPLTDPEGPAPTGERTKDSASRPSWKRIVLGLLIAFAVLTLTCAGHQALTWPDVKALATRNPETTAFIERYRDRQREAGRDPTPQWRWVTYDRISPHLKRAAVAGEDIEFFSHDGFSTSEIRAVFDEFLREGELRGASTITQQLAKNLWLSPSRNPLRKLKEALLTRQLEEHLTKERILEIYLNVAEFGRGIYGAEAAARAYFGKSAAGLNEREAAQLAASLPRPSVWHPGADSDRYWWYVGEILGRMEKANFLWRRILPDAAFPTPDTSMFEDPATTARFDTLRAVLSDSLVQTDSLAGPDSARADTTAADTTGADTTAADTTATDTTATDTTAADTTGTTL